MTIKDRNELAVQVEQIYEQRLKVQLEMTHYGQFVAIEPMSGDFFMGSTLTKAIWAASMAYPDRRTYALRIGNPVAIESGNSPRRM